MIIVFDISNKKSFEDVPNWLSEAKDTIRNEATILLVGTKNDLNNLRKTSFNEAAKFCQDNGKTHYSLIVK